MKRRRLFSHSEWYATGSEGLRTNIPPASPVWAQKIFVAPKISAFCGFPLQWTKDKRPALLGDRPYPEVSIRAGIRSWKYSLASLYFSLPFYLHRFAIPIVFFEKHLNPSKKYFHMIKLSKLLLQNCFVDSNALNELSSDKNDYGCEEQTSPYL